MFSKNRVVRVIKILEYLRTLRSGTTSQRLAEQFDVSVRQIYRDLNTLREVGLTIETEQGRGGGVRLIERRHRNRAQQEVT